MNDNKMERLTKKIDYIEMHAQIYDYLVGELYPLPNCNDCQYANTMEHRKPCSTCKTGYENYKLSKVCQADIEKLTRGLIRIFKKTQQMTLNEYQDKAMSTCMDSCDNFSYMMLNLVGEVGELASKVAKDIRKGNAWVGQNELYYSIKPSQYERRRKELMLEAGDILWQLAGLCYNAGWTLEEVAQANLDKLQARKQAGTIDGNGDGIYNR